MFIVSAIKPKHIQTINVKNESKKGDKKTPREIQWGQVGLSIFLFVLSC